MNKTETYPTYALRSFLLHLSGSFGEGKRESGFLSFVSEMRLPTGGHLPQRKLHCSPPPDKQKIRVHRGGAQSAKIGGFYFKATQVTARGRRRKK